MRRNGLALSVAWATAALLVAGGSASPSAGALSGAQSRSKLPVTATAPSPGVSQTPAGTAQITGTIRSATDDKPLARARIIASSPALPEPRVALSAANGTYVLDDLPAGAYTLTISHTGYAPQMYGQARAKANP